MEERRRGDRRAGGLGQPCLYLVPESTESGAVRIALGSEPVLVGRDASNHLRDQSADISRFHCRVDLRADGKHVLTDTGSTYGTWVDGERVAGEVTLRSGQVLGLGENGNHRIRVELAQIPWHEPRAPAGSGQRGTDAHRSRLRTILAQVGSTLDLDASLARVVEVVGSTLQAERVFLMLEEEGELVERACRGVAARLAEDADVPRAALQRAMARGQVRQWLPDRGTTDEIERSLLARGVTSAWFLPLRCFEGARPRTTLGGAGSRVGVVYADTRDPLPLRCDEATLEFLAVLADVVALQVANARLYHRATHDALTGLRNRSWFDERLDRILEKREEGATVAVILADLDNFKRINDTWDHLAGDDVLRDVAARFRATVGASGAACRHGGEELVVLLPGCDTNRAVELAEALRRAVAERPVKSLDRQQREVEIPVTASFGVACLGKDTLPRRSELVKAADHALQRAKDRGRNRVERHESGPPPGMIAEC